MTASPLKSAAPVADEWPELVPLQTPSLPRLDLDQIPGWAGEYARAIATATETPPELAAAMVLAACSAAAARRLKVRVKPDYLEPCNLWLLVALPPGSRKSSVQQAATAPMVAWERDKAAALREEKSRLTSKRQTMEARAKQIRTLAASEKDESKAEELAQEAEDLEAGLPVIPLEPRIWTSDATPERLGSLMEENEECMAWLSSEAGLFDILQGRYSNGMLNLDLALKAHSGDAERVDRKGRPPVFLSSPRLTLGISAQPEVLSGLAKRPGFRGRGLPARFLYLLPPSMLGHRTFESNPVPEAVRNAYASGLYAMLDWELAVDENGRTSPHVVQLSRGAYDEWLTFAKGIEHKMRPGGDLEHHSDWAGKAPGAAVRLAGVLHAIKHAHGEPWKACVTVETMAAALELMSVIVLHSVAALDIMAVDPTIAAAQTVWNWVERRRTARFKVRDAYQALRSPFPRVAQVEEALRTLEERGYVRIMKLPSEGPGRPPSPLVQVRPALAGGWS